MPEIGEVAKLVHTLRKNLVGKTISSVEALEDTILYKDTNAYFFKNAISKKRVVDANQQGKYFWIEMSSPPHIVAHLGMTGWMNFSNDTNSYYKAKKEENSEWPPEYWKFILKTDEDPPQEVAFVDPRRLGRIRLVDCPAKEIRNNSPLKENGPDPVIDKERLTKDWFIEKIKKKKVPVKAWLLDQANVSGVGNWVGDEILYHAKIHPEQYTNTLSDAQLSQLHTSLMHVCAVAVETLGDSALFPSDWLMKHRWGKGKNIKLPNGQKIEKVKVGGRTSAFVPEVQKKTGPTADEVEGGASKKKALAEEDDSEDEIPNGESLKPSNKRTLESKPKSATPKKPAPKVTPKEATPKKAIAKQPTPSKRKVKDETQDENEDAEEESSFEEPEEDDDESDYESSGPASKKRKGAEKDDSDDDYGKKSSGRKKSKSASGARRRSTRNRG